MRPLTPSSARPLPYWSAAALIVLSLTGCRSDTDSGASSSDRPRDGCEQLAGRSIRWIVPYSPGGGHDIDSRLLEPYLEQALAAEIVVQNRPGAGGLVGARVLRDAEPDGLTLGLINATALLAAELVHVGEGLHPTDHFTPLGRIAAESAVWLARAGGAFDRIEAVLNHERPVVFGLTDFASSGFVSISVVAEMLDLEVSYLAGYPGSREYSLGLMRGEVDLVAADFESVRDRVEDGDLRPVLQISETSLSAHRSLVGVPILGRGDGLAAGVVQAPAGAGLIAAQTAALVGMLEAGRMVVAPPGLSSELSSCLSMHLARIVDHPAFVATATTAGRTFGFQEPDVTAERLRATADVRRSLAPILERHAGTALGSFPRTDP